LVELREDGAMNKYHQLFLTFVILVGASILDGQMVAKAASSPQLVGVTPWSHSQDVADPHVNNNPIRGLAYDGHYYYIADIAEPGYNRAGTIYIYDENGFVRKIPDTPPVQGVHFPHGVATDGVSVWTTDYWGRKVYQYDIETGQLVDQFSAPISSPVRLDYDQSTNTLWMTGYNNPNVYQVDMNGSVVSSFATTGLGVNIIIALDGAGGIWVASDEANAESGTHPPIHLLKKYSLTGSLLEEYNFFTGWWAMATNINDRSDGFYQDTKPVIAPGSSTLLSRIEHYSFCDNVPLTLSLEATPDILWPPDHEMWPIYINASVSPDKGAEEPYVRVTSVTIAEHSRIEMPSDDTVNTYDENNFEPDYEMVDDTNVNLRAERGGKSEGRTYFIEVTATDCSGDYKSTVEISVPHSSGN